MKLMKFTSVFVLALSLSTGAWAQKSEDVSAEDLTVALGALTDVVAIAVVAEALNASTQLLTEICELDVEQGVKYGSKGLNKADKNLDKLKVKLNKIASREGLDTVKGFDKASKDIVSSMTRTFDKNLRIVKKCVKKNPAIEDQKELKDAAFKQLNELKKSVHDIGETAAK